VSTLYDAFGRRQVATIFGQLDQRRVILEATPSYQEDATSLAKLYVRSTTLTLYTTPVICIYLSQFTQLFRRWKDLAPAGNRRMSSAVAVSRGRLRNAANRLQL
jgi:multidrug efflux pump subunit AcrB